MCTRSRSRLWSRTLAGGALSLGLACSTPVPPPPAAALVVSIDTLRADRLGAYGHLTSTAHIDRLARRGTLFEDASSAVPITAPSHASRLRLTS